MRDLDGRRRAFQDRFESPCSTVANCPKGGASHEPRIEVTARWRFPAGRRRDPDPGRHHGPRPGGPAARRAAGEPGRPAGCRGAARREAPRIFQQAWEIVVDGRAEANGTLELVFQPQGGAAKLIKVNVVAKTKKDEIAKELEKEIIFAAGSSFKVKASGDRVKVKVANKKMPPFHLGIETQAVNGVAVRVGKG